MAKNSDKKPSTRLRDTHVIANPFLEDGKRFVHLCFCGYHTGIVHPATFLSKGHCGEKCNNIRRVYFNHKVYDEEKVLSALESQMASTRQIPTVSLTPFVEGEDKYFWVLDRGEHLYFLRPDKAHLVEEIERDHKRIEVSQIMASNNFKPYFVE